MPSLLDPEPVEIDPASIQGFRRGPLPVSFPPLSARARQLLFFVLALFVGSVALKLNGSSSGHLRVANTPDTVLRDGPDGLWFSLPKSIRSDEFLVCTPELLSQTFSRPSFPVNNPSYGEGCVPLITSMPTRHYTMIFRPGLWGFFVAPVEWAFSWYWNLKIFGLFTACFLLFWVLTQGRFGLSVIGTLLVEYSGYVQWWFSSPAMLPEMLTAWAIGTLAVLGIFVASSPWRRGVCGALFVACFASFFLCCYPPFEIPLFYLSLVLVAGYVWQHHLPFGPGLLVTGSGLLIAGLALVPWFLDARTALEAVAHTSYPGQRVCFGGTLPLNRYFSGLFSLNMDEANVPPIPLWNICEASNFYPLWIIPVLVGASSLLRHLSGASTSLGGLSVGSVFVVAGRWVSERALKVLLTGYCLVLTWYAIIGLPGWLCTATLLGRCTEQRCLLTIGLTGTILLVLCLPSRTLGGQKQRSLDAALICSAWTIGVCWFLHDCKPIMPNFLVAWRWAVIVLCAVAFAVLYLWTDPAASASALLGLLLLQTASINPISSGLPELTRSKAQLYLRSLVEKDPSAVWAGYDTMYGSETLKACGAHVLSGMHTVPDFAMMRKFDPGDKHRFDYNRMIHLIFEAAPPDQAPRLELHNGFYLHIFISPRDLARSYPALRYIICTWPLEDFASQDLEPVGPGFSVDHLWIYRVKRNQADLPVQPLPVASAGLIAKPPGE